MSSFESPFPVGRTEAGFSLYLPPYDLQEQDAMQKVRAAKLDNEAVSAKRITGSFIYAHPADYCGRPMLHASKTDWLELFEELRKKQIDTVIFQAALWRELNECYYCSQRYTELQQFKVIEPMLDAAGEKKITVYLGGYGSVAGWAKHLSEAELQAEINEHRLCFKELSKLGKFAGCYFPCETAYAGERNTEAEQRMHRLYRSFSETVREFDDSLCVIASPAGHPYENQKQDFLDFWNAILHDSGVDIIMPQDTIGNCSCQLTDLPEMWQWWKNVAQSCQIKLWGHIELFERRSYLENINLYPASPKRIATQIALAATVVEKMIAWEVPYFASAVSGPEGELLGNYLQHSLTGSISGQVIRNKPDDIISQAGGK